MLEVLLVLLGYNNTNGLAAGYVEFVQFFKLFLPSLVNFIIPAFIMSFFIDGSADEVEIPCVVKARCCGYKLFIPCYNYDGNFL